MTWILRPFDHESITLKWKPWQQNTPPWETSPPFLLQVFCLHLPLTEGYPSLRAQVLSSSSNRSSSRSNNKNRCHICLCNTNSDNRVQSCNRQPLRWKITCLQSSRPVFEDSNVYITETTIQSNQKDREKEKKNRKESVGWRNGRRKRGKAEWEE